MSAHVGVTKLASGVLNIDARRKHAFCGDISTAARQGGFDALAYDLRHEASVNYGKHGCMPLGNSLVASSKENIMHAEFEPQATPLADNCGAACHIKASMGCRGISA